MFIIPLLALATAIGIGAYASKQGQEDRSTPPQAPAPPDWVVMAVQQAVAQGDPAILMQTANMLDQYGWGQYANLLRDTARYYEAGGTVANMRNARYA